MGEPFYQIYAVVSMAYVW